MMAVTRALCLATGGPQPSVQSASYNLKHNNYSAVAPAYLIIKASGNVPWACSLQKKIPKPCLRGSELYNWFSHGLLRAAKSQFQKKYPIWEDSQNFSEFLRISENFSEFFRISERFGRKWSVLHHCWSAASKLPASAYHSDGPSPGH